MTRPMYNEPHGATVGQNMKEIQSRKSAFHSLCTYSAIQLVQILPCHWTYFT